MAEPRAFRLMIVWMVNNLLFVLIGLGGLPVNWLTYLVAHGGELPIEGDGRGFDAWAGYMPFVVPWWYFALSAAVMVVVVVLCRDPAWRWAPEPTRWTVMWRTSPPFLVAWAVFFVVFQGLLVHYYDVSWVVLNPYLIGSVLSIVALVVAVRIWNRDARANAPRITIVASTGYARALAIVSAVNLAFITLLGTVVLAAQQLAYLATTGDATPPVGDARTAADVWFGHLPLPLPWWILFASGLVTLAVMILSLRPQFQVARSSSRPFFLATTRGPLILVSAIAFIVQWFTAPYYSDGAELLLGPAACVAAIAVGLFSLRHTVGRARPVRGRAGVSKRA